MKDRDRYFKDIGTEQSTAAVGEQKQRANDFTATWLNKDAGHGRDIFDEVSRYGNGHNAGNMTIESQCAGGGKHGYSKKYTSHILQYVRRYGAYSNHRNSAPNSILPWFPVFFPIFIQTKKKQCPRY